MGAACSWRRKMALGQHQNHAATTDRTRFKLRRILQRPVGNPCPCSNNTRPSLRLTNRPSNSRSLPRNHMAPQWARLRVRLWHNHRLDSGNLSHEPCSTIPSSRQTSRPANSQIHRCNCRDLQASAAMSRWAARWAAGGAAVEVRSVGNHGGEYGSTTLSCPPPTCSPRRQRS